jgi:hypothetical protein
MRAVPTVKGPEGNTRAHRCRRGKVVENDLDIPDRSKLNGAEMRRSSNVLSLAAVAGEPD